MDIEEKYASLQEEAAGKTKKLKKVWTMLQSAKSEVRQEPGDNQIHVSDQLQENRLNKMLFLSHFRVFVNVFIG